MIRVRDPPADLSVFDFALSFHLFGHDLLSSYPSVRYIPPCLLSAWAKGVLSGRFRTCCKDAALSLATFPSPTALFFQLLISFLLPFPAASATVLPGTARRTSLYSAV